MKYAIAGAWSVSDVLHFETRAYAAKDNTILNEFSIVWQNKASKIVTLQTGMGVIELDEAGKWIYLRDYFDASSTDFSGSSSSYRQSAQESPGVRRFFDGDN